MAINNSEIIESVYLISGDNYLKKHFKDDIFKKIEQKYGKDECESVFLNGLENNVDEIIKEISNPGLFTKAKLIIIREAEKLLKEEGLINFLITFNTKKNIPHTVIIETKKKIKGLKLLQMNAPYENKLPGWIINKFTEKRKKIDNDAVRLLIFYCGRNLSYLSTEIEKIWTSLPDKDFYDIKDIKSVVGSHKKDDIFGYLDALMDGNLSKAMELLENLLTYGAQPLKIVAMLKWKLQQMMIIRDFMDKGMSEKDIIKKITTPKRAFFLRGICRKFSKFSMNKLLANYNSLQKIDVLLKTTSIDKSLLLEKFSITF